MPEPDTVRVVIADDSDLFCSALEAILEPEPGIAVLGRASDGEEAVRLAQEHRPEVLLMDISMPVLDGFTATERIRAQVPETAVVILTGSADEADLERATAAGAAGYITKDRIAGEVIAAVRSAARR